MDTNELQEILQSDKKLTLKDVKEIIYKLMRDCFDEICKASNKEYELAHDEKDPHNVFDTISFYQIYTQTISERQFYQGQSNAFYLCLDLLNKIGEPNE